MTGQEIMQEINRQMRSLSENAAIISFDFISMGRDDFNALKTYFEDCGMIPVMWRRGDPEHAEYHGIPMVICDQAEQPKIIVSAIAYTKVTG